LHGSSQIIHQSLAQRTPAASRRSGPLHTAGKLLTAHLLVFCLNHLLAINPL
jgi:hypothetical protein